MTPDRFNLQSEQSNIKILQDSQPKIPLKMNEPEANFTPKTKNTINVFNISSIIDNSNQQISNSNIENSFSIRKKLALLSRIFTFELKKIGIFVQEARMQNGQRALTLVDNFSGKSWMTTRQNFHSNASRITKLQLNSSEYGLLSFKNQSLYNKKNSIFIATLRYFNINDNLHLIHKVNYSVETFDRTPKN